MAKTKTSWKPGESGNPKGRPPKGYSISDAFRELFNENPNKKKKLVNAIYTKAVDGEDTTAMRLIWNYMDGMPKQDIKHSGLNAGLLEESPEAFNTLMQTFELVKNMSEETAEGEQ